MDINEAMEEVWAVAKGPRRVPPDAVTVEEEGGVELLEHIEKKEVQYEVARERVTLAQETVCRWVWGLMACHLKSFEAFEAGFLYDYNVDHELAMWVRMALAFESLLKLHRSANKREVVLALCSLSLGLPPIMLTPKRAKELIALWNGKGMDVGEGIHRTEREGC